MRFVARRSRIIRNNIDVDGGMIKCEVYDQMGECWENFELRNIAVVDYYKNETQHLVVEVPFIGCAHCGDNIINTIPDRKSTRLNSSHSAKSRMPSSA